MGALQEPVRACHVIHSLGPGGAESVLVDLAAAAPAAGLDISVVSLMPADGAVNARRLRALGVPVSSLELPTRWDPRGLWRGSRAIAALRPDIVHTHLKHADLVGAVAARRLGVPQVSTLHLVEDAVSPMGGAKRWLTAQVRNRTVSSTVAVSEAVRQWYLAAYAADPDGVRTVRNGVSRPTAQAAARHRIRAELGLDDDAVVAVLVGIMRPGKGHAELIAAAATLDPRSRVRFVLAGDGPLRPALERAAATLPPGLITFAGYRNDVPELLAAADLVVHPSHFDALPTALISALAAGRPVVATAVGGIPEIVTPDVGVLVPPGDVPALATAVTALAEDPDRRHRLGAAALDRFESEFEAGRWARRLRDLYDELRKPCAVSG